MSQLCRFEYQRVNSQTGYCARALVEFVARQCGACELKFFDMEFGEAVWHPLREVGPRERRQVRRLIREYEEQGGRSPRIDVARLSDGKRPAQSSPVLPAALAPATPIAAASQFAA